MSEFIFRKDTDIKIPYTLKIIPIQNDVVFPHLVRPLIVENIRGISAIKDSTANDTIVGIVTQNNARIKETEPDNLYQIGTAVTIGKVYDVSEKNARILLEGL